MPVVIYLKQPRTPLNLPKLPQFSERSSKILTAIAGITICVTMVSFVAYGFITGSDKFKKDHNLAPDQTSGSVVSEAAQPGGAMAVGSGGTSGSNSPVVTLTATPGSVNVGGKSHLKWSVTNNPTSCQASDDWSGTKPASGEADTPTLSTVQSYLFTLTCKNATGTGFSTVSVGAISQTGSGQAGRPVVKLSADPSAIFTGDKSTLIWSASGDPASCSASGDWSGNKISTSSENTPVLTTAKKYTYTLTCKNSEGVGSATATVLATAPPANLPNVTISSSALGNVQPGSSVTLNWTVLNKPTSCTASGDWSGAKAERGSQTVGPLNEIKTYNFKLTCSNGAGSTFDSIPVQVIPPPPVVSLSLNPGSITVGSSSVITWSASNNPSSCTASGSWTGTKSASGIQNTGAMNTAKTYTYSLSCTNAGGTGFANNVPLRVTAAPVPVVNISVSPISAKVGDSATITWSVSNSPSSCTASGDWSGSKAASGSQSTGTLSVAKNYNYTLSCSNSGGSSSGSAGVSVSSGTVVTKPAITISVSPSTIGTGQAATINWSVTNSPTSCTASGSWSGSKAASGSTSTGAITTAGARTYTLSCSNSAGSSTASASLNVLATPVISISASPATITTGSSSTLSWSVTNNPTSCTASGSWSGSKAASGSQTLSPSAGSYTYTLSCTNSGGTTTGSASLTVNPPAAVYCGGKSPCLGRTDLSQHAVASSCWGWNLDWVIDITSYSPAHKGGATTGSIISPSTTCNHDIHSYLDGTGAIPGYIDMYGYDTHWHAPATLNNSSGTQLSAYFKGYYDPNKP